MSKSRRKTRLQKIRATNRRQSQLTTSNIIVPTVSFSAVTQIINASPPVTTSPTISSLYAYPVSLIRGDMVKSLVISGLLLAGLGVITWTW